LDKITGGMFGLGNIIPTTKYPPPFLKEPYVLLVNARSCLSYIIQIISPKIVWMPSFLCDVMLKAAKGSKVKFYEINYDLEIQSLDWISNINDDDLVVLIDYFGMPVDHDIVKEIKKRGAWIIEDASQALLSNYTREHSDFIIFSVRKFIGVPDGGILIINRDIKVPEINLKPPPVNWWLKTFNSVVLRREFDLHGGDRLWFKLFQEVDAEGPIGNYSMSELSENIIRYCYNYSRISKKRRNNYRYLYNILNEYCIFSEFHSEFVPLGFPIRLKNRDEVRKTLFDQQIYPAIHWDIKSLVPNKFKESHKLSNEIMTLPCDQRYSLNDMGRMGGIILDNGK